MSKQANAIGWKKSKSLSTSWSVKSAGDLGSSLRFTTGKMAIKNRARIIRFSHSHSDYHRMIELEETLRDELTQKVKSINVRENVDLYKFQTAKNVCAAWT